MILKVRVSKKRKSIFAMVAILAIVLAMIGGTFAWRDFSQNKVNKFHGTNDPDVTLHDEFEKDNPAKEKPKHIFVENSGTQDVYVRIRLDEYMEISGESFVTGAKVREKNTWTPHKWNQDISKIVDCDGGGSNPDEKFHEYYQWNVKGDDRDDYTPGTPGLVYTRLDESGAYGKIDRSGSGETVAEMMPVTMKDYTDLLQEIADVADDTKPTKTTLSTEAHATKLATDSGCWILDADGWAYWSKVLQKEEATNLLLTSVKELKTPTDDWYYGIDVKMQAVTSNDFDKWADGPHTKTGDADKLIATWQAR